MRPSRAERLLAYPVTAADAAAVFTRLGMTHRTEGDRVDVEVPGYRVDVDREVDLIEEVARIQGYERVGSSVPAAGRAGGAPPAYAFRQRVRDALARAGLREAVLLSFASAQDLQLTGDTDAVPVANPLQAEEGFLRTRLTPGLLHAVARGNGEFDLRQSIAQRQRTHQVAQRQQKIADVPRQHLALTDVGHIAARTLVEPDEDATLLRHVPH
jgi:phenylalanyl-tRNA synthetase beta chain